MTLRSPKQDKRLPSFLTQTEITKLIEQINISKLAGKRDKAILELLYSTGCRVSELSDLQIRDVDLASGIARLKGKGKKGPLTPAKMGKHGDQIQRLFESTADIFFVQYWDNIGERVRLGCEGCSLQNLCISQRKQTEEKEKSE